MDKDKRKRAPPIGALYAYKRSSTIPFCRITGKSHSMDEHHYVFSSDDYPKFERHSGCRITEKNHHFKDYKYAYPIIDLDGTTRMVTEHDFHCRITSKYRAMAGHKYLYPVLGAFTDKTVDDMTSVVEDESMRDVLIPTEVELIVKGGVEDVLKSKDSEYLFIHSKEGCIIPAALKEIRGKGAEEASSRRRHTLPVSLEAGIASDLEEFRRSVRIKMLSEIKKPDEEIFGTSSPPEAAVFDAIGEEVQVLTDIRKSRPKRPGKRSGGSFSKKKRPDGEATPRQESTSKEEVGEVPQQKLSRMEKYKLQFGVFETKDSKESGNRLTLIGAFDENEVEELDFGEPMEIQCSTVVQSAQKLSAVMISDVSEAKPMVGNISNGVQESLSAYQNGKNGGYNNAKNGMDTITEDVEQYGMKKISKKLSSSISSWESTDNLACGENVRQTSVNVVSGETHVVADEININSYVSESKTLKKYSEVSEAMEDEVSESISPKKVLLPPHSAASKNLMNELKEKLSAGKKVKIVEKSSNIENESLVIHESQSKADVEALPFKKKADISDELKNILEKRNKNLGNESNSNDASEEITNEDPGRLKENVELPAHKSHSPNSDLEVPTVPQKRKVDISDELKNILEKRNRKIENDDNSNDTSEQTTKEDSGRFKENVELPAHNSDQPNSDIEIPIVPQKRKVDVSDELKNILEKRNRKLDDDSNSNDDSQRSNEDSGKHIGKIGVSVQNGNVELDSASKSKKDEVNENNTSESLDNISFKSPSESIHKSLNESSLKVFNSQQDNIFHNTSNFENTTKESHEEGFRMATNVINSHIEASKTFLSETSAKSLKEDKLVEAKNKNERKNDLKLSSSLKDDLNSNASKKEITSSTAQLSSKEKVRGDVSSDKTVLSSESTKCNIQTNTSTQNGSILCSMKEKIESEVEIKGEGKDITTIKRVSEKEGKDVQARKNISVESSALVIENKPNGFQDTTNDANALKTECDSNNFDNIKRIHKTEEIESINMKEKTNSQHSFEDISVKEKSHYFKSGLSVESETNKDSLSSLNVRTVEESSKFTNSQKGFPLQSEIEISKNTSTAIRTSHSEINGFNKQEIVTKTKDSHTTSNNTISNGKSSESFNEISHKNESTLSNTLEQIGSKSGVGKKHVRFPMSLDSPSLIVGGSEVMEVGMVSKNDSLLMHQKASLLQNHTTMIEGNGFSLTHTVMNDQKETIDIKDNGVEDEGIDVYVAIMDFKPMASDEEAVTMKEGQQVEVIDASKPRRWLVKVLPMTADESVKEGYVPACYLEKSTAYETLSNYVVTEAEMDPKELEAMQNREAIVKELVETEEDFAKDMLFVVDNYYKQMDNPRLPKEFRDRKGSVFSNFKDISDFHNNVLMKGVNYHAKEPTKLGKTFLRLERDFDMHASYCWNEARAQKLLKEGPLKEFFDEHSKMLDDDKQLIDHLKLPIQRLNDYQLLLKELIKYSSRLNEDTTDLQKALDFIHSINTRTKDLLYIQNMEGCQGDLLKIGRIIRHDVFDVTEGNEVSASEKYVFLFKGRVFITEKKITTEKESYHVTNLFKLQDVDFIENVEGDQLKVSFKSHKKNRLGFPLSLRARSLEQKATWIKELLAANQVVEDLGDLEPSLEHTLEELPASKSEESIEGTESEKPPKVSLKRQASVKKPTKTPDSSVPATPTDTDAPPPFSRQDSVKKPKKSSGDSSAPETPTESSEKRPRLSRQESKKSKSSDEPETPVEASDKPPRLTRQDSKKSSKASDASSEPPTPTEGVAEPPFSRQDSVKSKKSEPQTPVDSVPESPLIRQDSVKSKGSNKSEPQTPVDSVPESPLIRQDSVKSKGSDKSEPQTPVDAVPASPLTRQDSVKSKTSNKSEPQTPTESVPSSPLTRQDSVKSKASDKSEPQTPTEAAPPFTRQDSVKKKPKKASVTDSEPPTPIAEESQPPSFGRQESVKKDKKTKEEAPKLGRQDSAKEKPSDKKPKQGEDSSAIPRIIMSEDASYSDARMESIEFGDENLTLGSESFRSDDSMTPTGSEFDSMDKPRFSKTLRGVTYTLGETAVLECETEGSPVPSVTWLKDNQKIAKSKRVTSSSAGQKHSLTIKDVVADDGGLYTVVASSSKGSASCSAPLNLKLALLGLPKEDSRPTTPGGTVLPHAPVFKVKLNKETQLLEGTSVRFELVVRGSPEPLVKFLKDGKELKLDDRVRVSYESKEVFELILEHVVAKDAGTYTIVASNPEGEDKTTGSLSVVKTKDIFKGLEDTSEEEREPTPRPKTPKFKWFKDGQYFEANERFQVIFNEEQDSLALMFQHVTPEDAGLYTCVASTSTGSKIACSAELTVQGVIRQVEAPAIKAELSDAEATEGGSAMLELKITGFPKPKVTWYHKNKEVSTGGRFRFLFADEETFTLVVKNVKKEDGGKFSVKAVNEMGEAESSCTLTVKSSPSFVKGLKDMSIMAEDLLKLEVQIDGNPAPEVKWYKDGQPLSPNDHIKIVESDGKQALLISGAKPTDSGSYSCVITNDLGNQAEFSNVVVKASPTFVKGMANVQGLEGETLVFNVEINGNPKPTLKWSKDGKDLSIDGKRIKVTEESANVYTLTIEKATAADVGAYTCEIRNEHGMKASTGNLNIKMKPEFIKKLSDLNANEGDIGLLLNTTTKGFPTPTIKWFCGDVDLKDNKNVLITTEKDGSSHCLKIKKVNRKDAGKYTCEASNEMGKATTSGELKVTVTTSKPEIYQQLKPTQLVEGKPGKLEGKITGEPKPKISWLKDGKPISLNGRFSMEEADDGTVTLNITSVSPDDAGIYSVVATSDEGEATLEAPVTTIPAGKKPEFVKELEKRDLLEGQPLRLEAKVTGKPTSIKWQKDNEDLADDGRIKITENPDGTIALLIDKVNQTDAGKYTVIATNSEGKARSAALVQVQAMKKPEILGGMEPLTIKDGDTGELKVKATGEPKPTVTWLKDGKVLRPTNRVESIEEPDGTIALVIKNARPEDAGNYSVVVENSMGEAKSSAPVAVEQAPTFQKPLAPVNVVEGYPAKLEAKLAGSPPPEIKWFKEGEEIIPDNIHVKEIRDPDGTVALLIDDCKPEDAGKYSLTAKNPLGENSSSGKLGVTGKESSDPPSAPCFVSPIGDLTVKEGEPIRFEAAIAGNPLPDISWVVNDRPLTPSDNTLITFDGEKAILEIRSSTPDHIGKYQCKLINPLGEASNEGSVSVQEKTAPRFIQRLTDFNGFMDQPMKLSCKVTGYPEPEINWYLNGDLISPKNPKYTFSNIGDVHSLTLHSAKPEDSGMYECVAKNSVGEDHTRSGVNISDKIEKGEAPMFLKRIGDNEVMEGMTAKFTACVTGIPTPDVTWFKDGEPLEPSSRHKMELESTGILRLMVREVESGDYGEYSVTLRNAHGSASCSAKLIPDSLDDKYMTPIGDQFVDFGKFKKTGIPVPLSERPRIIRMGDTSLTLGWKPSVPNTPRAPVTYQLEMAKHPDGEWTPYKIGLKDTLCDVRDLRPGQDYKFQVRVENKHGISDPSPYVTAHRSKIYQPPNPADFKPKDYSLEHPPISKYAAPPKFLRREEDAMYGVRGHPVTLEFWVYGQPQPQVTWFKGESQIGKDKYGFLQDRNGKLNVFIDCMNDDFVGTYTCVAVNDEGEATMKIKLLIAEPPIFLERLDETTAMSRRSARMQCRVTGLPYPRIKWFRDWHPLYESERVKMLWEEPDICTLFISNLITRDNALYSCQATNIAGTATSSAALNVEDSEDMFDYKTYCRPIPVRPRTKIFEDFYDIGDELGRGTQGITYHAVKRDTGDSFAAKTMHGKGKLKEYMKIEMDNMNQLCHPKLIRLRDAFETKDTLTLVTDICGGGELLGNIIKRGGVSERDVANYVKQMLEGLEYMHSRYFGHLGLSIGDVLVARVNSDDVRFGDFSLAARLLPGKNYFSEYGHPEFVAPEIAKKEPATLLSDMWSVGVITYLLLSGISPFLGENDRETLTRVQQGKINFIEEAFSGVSDDAKDFMSKLLVFDPKNRMDVKAALQHRWFKYYQDKPKGDETPLGNLDRLKEYQRKWNEWYANASCKRFFRRRTLESCFHHPSRMIYPPGEPYTPSSSPEPMELDRTHAKPSYFDDVTFKQKINREDIDFRSESSYQNGPDTYLLQLRDTDFPLRLREYLRVGASTCPSIAANLRDKHWGDSTLVIRERRKFVDVMDEEIDDEKKGLTKQTVPRRLYHEIGTLGFAREQMEQLKKEVWKEKSREIEIGMAPYFREKIRNTSMKEEDEVVFTCYAVGSPNVDYTWFRNDGILLESSRIVVTKLKDGRSELRINPTRAYDIGVYKCVARNMHGVSCCRARLKLGGKPGRPEAPVVKSTSDTEIYITWAVPRDEGNCTTLGYALEYKKSDEESWHMVLNNIEHEYFVVKNLSPSTFYQFRVQAFNKFGWGLPGFHTEPVSTKEEGAPKVKISPRRKYQQEFTERTPDYELVEAEIPILDYSIEENPIPLTEGEPLDLYRIVSEMDRGRFSVVLNVWVKETNTSNIAKVIQATKENDGKQEYEIMKSLSHERVVSLLSASYYADKTVLIMEKLSGVDIMSYLALRHEYNEELVITMMKQVLEALQYLHFRGICYLELQPDNVVTVNLRDPDIKLIDFGSARYVPKSGAKVTVNGTTEYLAPEVLKNEQVSYLTDVWCVGVLTYILLSGVSPFRGKDEEDTKDNVTYVRYHFDNLHSDVTAEATRFLLNIFKQCPIKRLTIDECLEHKWLAPSEYMMMKRESARFLPDKLKDFAREFHAIKYEAMNPEMLTSLGMSSSRNELKVDEFL